MECELLTAGTGIPCHMTLNPRMDQLPVLIERLEEELGQPIVENQGANPGAKEHRLHDILGNAGRHADRDRELQVFESRIHLPFCVFIGSRQLPEPCLRDRPRGLDPRNALLNGGTPGRTWKFIVYLVQQTTNFGPFGAELLTQRFCIAGEDMDALESESQPRIEEDPPIAKELIPSSSALRTATPSSDAANRFFFDSSDRPDS